MKYDLTIVLGAGVLAMLYAFWKTRWIEAQMKVMQEMKSIGASIAEGANVFFEGRNTEF